VSNAIHRAPTKDAPDKSWLVWLGLPLFFIGCGCLTVAVVELASNHSISAVAAIIGVPLTLIGFVLIALKVRAG
jgi:hypothetical protein